MEKFELVSSMTPQGDQPQAIEKLTDVYKSGAKYQCLLGVTGSGGPSGCRAARALWEHIGTMTTVTIRGRCTSSGLTA